MRTILLVLMFLLFTTINYSQNQGVSISVTIDNVTSNKGTVIFGLHTADTFMKAESVQTVITSIENGKVKAEFKNVNPGTYAIMVLHDENENKRMDFNENGMPSENYAMSNNPMSFGPPQFNDAKFEVSDQNLELMIRF